MPNHYSEQVAISYLRKFYLVKGAEEEQHSLTLVLKHIQYMPFEFQLISYWLIAGFYYHRQQWDKVLYYAKILEQTAKDGKYYAEALLLQAFALKRLGSSLNVILELIDKSAQVSDFYEDIAMANRLITFIEFGQLNYLDQCLSWFKESDYFYIALPLIIEGFVKVGRLEEAHQLLNHSQNLFNDFPTTNEPRRIELYLHFHYAHALYHWHKMNMKKGFRNY